MNDKDILDVCKENGIIVQAYGPVGSGTKNTFVGGPRDGVSTHGNYKIYSFIFNPQFILFLALRNNDQGIRVFIFFYCTAPVLSPKLLSFTFERFV